MSKKKITPQPSELPPHPPGPEIKPAEDPDVIPLPPEEEPDIIPEEDPFENPPHEIPPPGEGP